jgi:hypothetical protein
MKRNPRNSRKIQALPVGQHRCGHSYSDGRQCRNPRWDGHPALCLYHARRERLILDAERVAAELAPISGEFMTSTDVNHSLGRLFSLLAADRVPSRKAAVLAYLGQLLLHSLHGVRQEITQTRGFSVWDQIVRRSFPFSTRPLPSSNSAPTP